jgi:hypothetical protein
MHVAYLAGPNVDNSQTTFSTRVHINSGGNDPFGVYSRFIVAGSDATAWGVNVENTGNGQAFITLQRTGTTPIRWYNYIPSGSTDLRYYANAADRFTFTAGGSFTATGNVQGNSVNVGSNLQLQHSGYTLELWDPANIGLRTFKAGALIATYSVDATAMMITSAYHHRDPSTLVSKWLLYAPGNDNNWYFRDVMNGRMQMAFYPGVSSSAANTYIYSNLTVDSAVTVSGLLSAASVTTTGVISSATEFRLNNNTFSRVAQIDGAGGFGGGYNFNITGGTNRDSTGNVAGYYYTQNRIKFYAETSGAPGPISARAEIHSGGLDVLGTATINGHVYSQFRTLSADPTTLDIASGYTQLVKNTTSGEIRTWVNDGGTMKKSSAYT